MGRQRPIDRLDPPLLSAAGALNSFNPEAIKREASLFCRTALGGITFGSFTIPPQPGNEHLYGGSMYWDDGEGRTFNAMGLPNPGIEAACDLAPELTAMAEEAGKLAVFSCSPAVGPHLGNSVEQAVEMISKLMATPAPAIELNVSCPNLVNDETGQRKPIMGYDLASMGQLVAELTEAGLAGSGRLGLKLPPYLTEGQQRLIPKIAALLKKSDVFGFIVVSNTIPDQIPLDKDGEKLFRLPGGMGGLSGPAAAQAGREQLALWKQHFDGPIISALGVHSGQEMAARLDMGAAAVAGVSFLWNETRGPAEGVNRLLGEFVELQE